uniref:CUB domain-containing protein n=1 Tax=Ixodes ricinus TaxID=34613 RepID=A0A0K8R5X1_IXORI
MPRKNRVSETLLGICAAFSALTLAPVRGNGSCDHVIMSNSSKNGTITSPLYPNPYPENARCNYHFQGEGKERVQIKFTDFDLYMPLV